LPLQFKAVPGITIRQALEKKLKLRDLTADECRVTLVNAKRICLLQLMTEMSAAAYNRDVCI